MGKEKKRGGGGFVAEEGDINRYGHKNWGKKEGVYSRGERYQPLLSQRPKTGGRRRGTSGGRGGFIAEEGDINHYGHKDWGKKEGEGVYSRGGRYQQLGSQRLGR